VHDVVIVGGGLAGLTVAYRLRHRDIRLLEQEAEYGGRTLSFKLGPYIYNAGAQVIVGDHSAAARLADELGVARTLIPKRGIPIHMKGRLITASSELGFLWKLPLPLVERLRLGLKVLHIRTRYRDLAGMVPDPRNPKCLELSATTLKDFIGTTHPDTQALWDTLSIAANMLPSHEVAALTVIDAFLQAKIADEFAITGGTWELARALYGHVQDRVETSAKVVTVAHHGQGVEVVYEQNGRRASVSARKCVVAIPAPVVLEIVHDLPDWKKSVLSKTDFVATTSAAFLLKERPETFLGEGVWRVPVVGKRIVSVTNPSLTVPREHTSQGLLRVYCGDQVARELMQLPAEEGLGLLGDELTSIFPAIAGKIVSGAIRHWKYADHPWRVGRAELTPAIQAPTGDVHYCGDYTISRGLDAAVQSGERVIRELDRTGSTKP
jgi:oxygen-dependent protoporphyrinogen oxidase